MPPSARLGLTFAAVFALVAHAASWRSTWTDDAFITFRYARNFAAGEGMVFNAGDWFEGLTNLGWAMLLAPFSGGDVLLVAQIAGVLAGMATVLALAGWARREGLGAAATATMLGAMVLAPWPAYWMVQGLETPMVMLLCTVGWARYRTDATEARGALLSGPALGLGPWFRPDSALLAAIVGGWHLFARGVPRGRRVLLSAAAVVASAVALVAVKLAWYGEILPNTFHVKVGGFPPERGLTYLGSFLTVPSPLVPALLLAACVLGLARAARRDDRGLPGVIFLAYLAAATLQDGDFFANFRLLVPAWPAACAALGLAVQALGGVGAWSADRLRAAAAVAVGLAFVPLARVDAVDRLDFPGAGGHVLAKTSLLPWKSRWWDHEMRDLVAFPTAWALVNVGPRDVVAYSELGLLGFLQEGPVLDMLGLTDRVIAGRGGETHHEQIAYVEGRAAALVIDTGAGLWHRWRPTLADGWEPVAACDSTWVFRNPALPLAPPDAAELDRRLDLALDRVPRAGDLHLAIARELHAAGHDARVAPWLDAVVARGTVNAEQLAHTRCELGLSPGCLPRATCAGGVPRRGPADMGAPDAWPSADALAMGRVAAVPDGAGGPGPGAPGAPTHGGAVGPDGHPVLAPPLPDGAAATLGPDGQPLAAPPLPDGGGPPPDCADARTAASEAWEQAARAAPREPALGPLRRACREAARAARAGGPESVAAAERAAGTAPDALASLPELAGALTKAKTLSEAAVGACD